MSDLKKKLANFLSGKYSDEGKAMYDAWYNSFKDEDTQADIPSDEQIQQELFKIKSAAVRPVHSSQQQFIYWRIAAAVLMVVVAGAGVYLQWQQIINLIDPITYNEEITPKGSRVQLTLSDGSKVWLNAGTKFRYPEKFKRDTREVYLEGEAYFEVARDEHKPFIIHTSKLATTVLGTSFNVRAYAGEDQEVGVLSGKVSVAKIPAVDQAEQVILLPMQKAVLEHKTQQLVQLKINDASHYTAWKEGRFVADDLAVKDLVAQLERAYDTQIELSDESLGECHITAEFDAMPLERLLVLLNAILNTTYTKNGEMYVIQGAGCS